MKKLYLIRHAKSDWSNPNLDDFDRPLSKRGKKNAPFMGKILAIKGIYPDLIISSPAYRARETTQYIIEKLNFKNKIMYNEYLYESSLKNLIKIINFIDDSYKKVFIVGHNPALNMLAFYLTDFNENLPTCGIIQIEFTCHSWREINKKNAKFVSFDYSKKNYL